MATFKTHSIESAPDHAKPLLQAAQKAYGFVPNLLGNMASSPALLEGYMTLAGIFNKTNLTETERQIILMTNNRLNGCQYCMAAHTTIAKSKGVSTDVLEALRHDTPITDAKLEALRQFSIVVNKKRGQPSATQVSAFLAAGYTVQTVLDVILGTSLKVMSNYTNHITQTKLDAPFQANAWAA